MLNGMIDVSRKKITRRIASAQCIVKLNKKIIGMIKNKQVLKGDVLEQSRIAGIIAGKKTADVIPLCHPLNIGSIKISFSFVKEGIKIISEVCAFERTGVEMEALVACSISALNVYDMCKMYDRTIEISGIMLLKKSGGKSGTFRRKK